MNKNIKLQPIKLNGRTQEGLVLHSQGKYVNDLPAFELVMSSGEPYCHVSVNMQSYGAPSDPGCIYLDANGPSGLLEGLQEQGLVEPTGRSHPSGFVVYPEVRMSPEMVQLLD